MDQEQSIRKIETININLQGRYIETRVEGGASLRLSFDAWEMLQHLLLSGDMEATARKLLATGEAQPDISTPPPTEQATEEAPAPRQKSPALVLPGKLKTTPIEGKPDSHDKPTATAHFLAHMEGEEGAVRLFSTFHNHTRSIALRLSAGDPITAQGYLHPSRDPKRLSTFSIFHLINYPGKPKSRQDRLGGI